MILNFSESLNKMSEKSFANIERCDFKFLEKFK